MAVFLEERDYRQFVYLLGDVVEEFALHCWNYCLMPNHYHVTLQPTRANLSEAIRHLNSRYAQWWNRHHEKVGHVFQGRFKDQIVDRDEYLLALSRYVVMNPVRASLVQRPEDWAWSSYRATMGACQVPSFLATSKTLNLLGVGTEIELRTRFTRFVTACTEDPATVDRFRSNEPIIGTKAFKQRVESQQSAEVHV